MVTRSENIANSDMAIRFSDNDLLKEKNNMVIRRRFQMFHSRYRWKMCHISISSSI